MQLPQSSATIEALKEKLTPPQWAMLDREINQAIKKTVASILCSRAK